MLTDWRVPGLPIRNCAESSKNLLPRVSRWKVNAINVTRKIIFERLYYFQDWAHVSSVSTVRVLPHPHSSHDNYFSNLVRYFSDVAPHFCQHMIHQVIWPSPGTITACCFSMVPRSSARTSFKDFAAFIKCKALQSLHVHNCTEYGNFVNFHQVMLVWVCSSGQRAFLRPFLTRLECSYAKLFLVFYFFPWSVQLNFPLCQCTTTPSFSSFPFFPPRRTSKPRPNQNASLQRTLCHRAALPAYWLRCSKIGLYFSYF